MSPPRGVAARAVRGVRLGRSPPAPAPAPPPPPPLPPGLAAGSAPPKAEEEAKTKGECTLVADLERVRVARAVAAPALPNATAAKCPPLVGAHEWSASSASRLLLTLSTSQEGFTKSGRGCRARLASITLCKQQERGQCHMGAQMRNNNKYTGSHTQTSHRPRQLGIQQRG